MPDELAIQRIVAYLAQHGSTYSREEIGGQLAAAGYAADDIDAAFVRWQQPSVGATINVQPQATAFDNEAEIERMVAYLRQHQQRYSLDALRSQLINSGRSPELIAAALARVPHQPVAQGRNRWPFVLLLTPINLLLMPGLSYGLALLFGDVAYSGQIFLVIVGLELIGGIIFLFNPNTRWVGTSLLLSILLAIAIGIALAVLALVLLAGACIVFFRQVTGS